ncbi:MAG: type II toxin-antitoxin system VapC family toxin [Candidatus Rokubacteria bacterium]|nr:type II toxin-antitoxin system VapC family toxin [Candidatus Rokubacteria bacterium]
MKFWDSSAVVSLCVNNPRSSTVKSILLKDPSIVVWWATRTECLSALMRQARDGGLNSTGERHARRVLEALAEGWIEIQPTESLRQSAERLLAVHPLRAADAFQLAAALQWCQRQTKDMVLVSFDDRLRAAAYREGFGLLPSE